ncbi:hypothetical protein [Bacillus badius]|uniref:hypothetical protein n=2 Tax=Bacillus badius TaxID=1455 RepID=UPI0007B3F8A0|nr:hypothetical protein [Bacillus badius]KZR57850.1 hypothetical protein A3781_19470 [Bacillus badius]
MNREELSKIDAALLIGISTALGYGLSYVYEFNYQAYYYLPSIFVDLTINTVTRATFLMFMIVFMIIWVFYHFGYKWFSGFFILIKEVLNIYIIIGFIVILLFLGATFLGGKTASIKEQYMVIEQKEELYVAVTQYKDSVVIAPLGVASGFCGFTTVRIQT